jgi:GntR family transcriptional regulator
MRLDPETPFPLYYQIREQLRARIVGGELKPGDLLPSEIQLAAETGVSRMTARQALSQLASEGLVVRQRGRGTFVAAPKTTLPGMQGLEMNYTRMLEHAGIRPATRILRQEVLPASAEIAAQLHLSPGEPLAHLLRLRMAAGAILAVENSHLPARLVPGLEHVELANVSLQGVLETHYGLSLERATDTLEISFAGPYEAGLLQINEGEPVALVTSLNYLADDTPLLFSRVVHRGDRFRTVLRRGRQPAE